jgi:hypothetical protein
MERRAWGLKGEVQLYHPNFILAIDYHGDFESEFQSALKGLALLRVVQVSSDEIRVDRQLTTLLDDGDQLLKSKATAVQLLIHALPPHPFLDPQN